MDENLCGIEGEKTLAGGAEPEANDFDEYFRPNLIFSGAKNTRQDSSTGRMRFIFFPDGTKEFGMVTILDPSTNRYYTIFINPYFSSPEILEGAVDFEAQYAL